MALEKIDNNNIYILPRDTKADNLETIKKVEELYVEGVRIFIGPVFNKCLNGLEKYQDAIFLSLTNKILNNPKNVISAGINANSQFKAIKKFQKKNDLEKTLVLIPKKDYKEEIEEAIKNSKLKSKKIFYYDTEPTKLTKQIEKITRYKIRKQNLAENYSHSELVDACLSKNVNKTVRIINENNFSSEDCISIIRIFLAKSKRLLVLKKMNKQNDNIDKNISDYKPAIFWKDKDVVRHQFKHWTLESIEKLIFFINDIELMLKKNSSNSVYLMNDFILTQVRTSN